MLHHISPHLFSVVSILFLLYGIVFSESNPVDTPITTGLTNNQTIISDTATASDSSKHPEPLHYQPSKDQRFLDASKAPEDFTPLKKRGPEVPDRPDVLTDFSPYSPAKK